MQVTFARARALGSCVALALGLALLLAGCTTTTTITASEDAAPARAVNLRDQTATRSNPSRNYVVQRGDTLYAIAFRNRVDLRELIAWNELNEPYTIYPGQRLRIAIMPARDDVNTGVSATTFFQQPTRAPERPRVARGRGPEPSPRVEAAPISPARAVLPGTTSLQEDSEAARRVAEAPLGSEPSAPRSGSMAATPVASLPAIPIAVDEGVREAVADPSQSTSAVPGSTSLAAPSSVAVRTPATLPAMPQTPLEPARDPGLVGSAPTRMVGGIGWRWPSAATLVGRYAAADEARQGIRLQAPAGTPVHAAADGEVVYSGNGLVGLGELVIIKHGAEYLSAYGLNRKRLVTEGQKVRAGQPVAEMGNSAGVAGLLHFEVRRGGRPIDPLTVLPPR